jgi:hypothetical protein
MQHLSTERLAALADETPTPEEAAHLARCLACRRERDVYLALLDLARREGSAGVEPGALAAVGEPLSSWDAIAAGLRAEGLIDDRASRGPASGTPARRTAASAPAASHPAASLPARRLRPTATWWRQAAAASVLLVAGVGVGRKTAGLPLLPHRTASAPTADAGSATPSSFGGGLTLPTLGRSAPTFASVGEASSALARAQHDYQRAAAFLAEHDTTALVGNSDALRARLAALDEVIPRVERALYDAPQDPVLSQYYEATYQARETTIRQLGRALPAGVRLTGY